MGSAVVAPLIAFSNLFNPDVTGIAGLLGSRVGNSELLIRGVAVLEHQIRTDVAWVALLLTGAVGVGVHLLLVLRIFDHA